MADKKSLAELGGKEMLAKISKDFYDRVYAHPWIGQYFKDVPQNVIESQQVDFMNDILGGEPCYCGKLPIPAHKHMMITEELFDMRQQLLNQAFVSVGASEDLVKAWLKVDNAFRGRLIKQSLDQCEPRFRGDDILFFPDPERKKAA